MGISQFYTKTEIKTANEFNRIPLTQYLLKVNINIQLKP